MNRMSSTAAIILSGALFPISAQNVKADEAAIRTIQQQYVDAWLASDEEGVMQLFEAEATIVPNGLASRSGHEALRAFWFPTDSSRTTIHQFTRDILNVFLDGDVAESTQKTFLSWSYEKGSARLSREQKGYSMAIYRRQRNGTWKIWRLLWTDVWSQDR